MNLRHPPPAAPSGYGFAAGEIDRLLDDKRQARISFALIGGSLAATAGIIGWIVLAMI